MNRLRFLVALSVLVLPGCGDGLSPFVHTDIDQARADWLANRRASYSFEVTIQSSWSPATPYSVRVVNGVVVERVDLLSGTKSTDGETIDDIWDAILQARNRNQVNEVRFSVLGIPVMADVGIWAIDGGLSWQVTRYVPR